VSDFLKVAPVVAVASAVQLVALRMARASLEQEMVVSEPLFLASPLVRLPGRALAAEARDSAQTPVRNRPTGTCRLMLFSL
jgi:hypothetical protein